MQLKESKISKEFKEFKTQFSKKTLTLVTSGFGLVAALAWNELIKEIIATYIKPIFGKGSGIISLFIYATFVTILAVFVTYQLGKLSNKK